MWRERWGQDLHALADGSAATKRDAMRDKVRQLCAGESKEIIEKAYGLCSDLGGMWDRDPEHPYGLVRDEFRYGIGGNEGDLARFLETHRMLTKVVAAMAVSDDNPTRKQALDAIVNEMRDFCAKMLAFIDRKMYP